MHNRLLSLAAIVLLIPTASDAHDHTADICFAGSYAHDSHLWGALGTVAVTWPDHEHVSILFDGGFQKELRDGNDSKETIGLGIRYMFADDPDQKGVPFAHVLIGGALSRVEQVDVDYFAVALGGGIDYYPRADDSPFGFRAAIDVVLNAGGAFPRLSGGLVIRKRKATP